MELTEEVILPEGTSKYAFQVAGHAYDGKTKLGILKHENGCIIKLVKENDHRSARELHFYENVFSNKESDPLLAELSLFLPKFCGTCLCKVGDKEMKFLCLEDVCAAFTNPSMLDVKIGGKTYDPEADEAKVLYEKSKYEYSEILGFRILGMKVYCDEQKLYITKDKKFGKQVTPKNMNSVLGQLLTSNIYINRLILSGFLHKLTELKEWFKKQRRFAFYSSSLLFVYEGTLSLWHEWMKSNLNYFGEIENDEAFNDSVSPSSLVKIFNKNNCDSLCCTCLLNRTLCHKIKSSCDLIRVAIIDCAHVFPTSESDTNYVFGLENLICEFETLLKSLNKEN